VKYRQSAGGYLVVIAQWSARASAAQVRNPGLNLQ